MRMPQTNPTWFYSTYVVSAPLIAYYYTQMIGDAKNPPTLKASAGFSGLAVIGKCNHYFRSPTL